jgi:hypothetical protein
MATATTTAYSDASNLTNFNAWAYWVYQQFIAFGWVQTADTGQGTFPASGSVPSAAGYYAIFKSADSLTASCPIYVKIEFWATSNVPYFGLTVGTGGTNGAGSLTFPYTTRMYGGGTYALQTYTANTGNMLPLFASGDAGSMRLGLWFSNNPGSPDYYQGVYIIIARSRDNAGNQTGNYVQVWGGCHAVQSFQTVFAPSLGTTNTIDGSNSIIAMYPNVGNASWANGGAIPVSPVVQNMGGFSNPTPDLLVGGLKDFTPATTAVCKSYGVAHTYVAISCQQFNAFMQSQYMSLLMRYE